MFCGHETVDVSRGEAEGNIDSRGSTKHTAKPRETSTVEGPQNILLSRGLSQYRMSFTKHSRFSAVQRPRVPVMAHVIFLLFTGE